MSPVDELLQTMVPMAFALAVIVSFFHGWKPFVILASGIPSMLIVSKYTQDVSLVALAYFCSAFIIGSLVVVPEWRRNMRENPD